MYIIVKKIRDFTRKYGKKFKAHITNYSLKKW